MNVKLLITNNAKLNIEYDPESMNSLFFVIYKKLGEKKLEDGRTVPIFTPPKDSQYQRDRKIVKAEDHEISSFLYVLPYVIKSKCLPPELITHHNEQDTMSCQSLIFLHKYNDVIKNYGINILRYNDSGMTIFEFFIKEQNQNPYKISMKLTEQNLPQIIDFYMKLKKIYDLYLHEFLR